METDALSSAGTAAAILSALTQAIAHGLLKSGRDKLVIRGLIGLTGAICVLPACLFVPAPGMQLLPWLAASAAIHAVYQLMLIKAYEASDFAVAYPLARGVAPISTAVLGVVLLNDPMTPVAMAGIALASTGLLLLAATRHPDIAGVMAALCAGLLIAVYTIVDARGVRLAPTPAVFIVYFFLLDGLVMTSIALALRRRRIVALLRAEGPTGVAAGLVSLATYSLALIALRLLPVGIASTLRETSVLFGVLIARFGLKERIGLRRIMGALLITGGSILAILGTID
jgi:drug/metabolite transporter (DMT)-like permease